jgi:hypothetical protein
MGFALLNPSYTSYTRRQQCPRPLLPSEQFCESNGKADATRRQGRSDALAPITHGKRRARTRLDRANNRNRNRPLNHGRKTGQSSATEYY